MAKNVNTMTTMVDEALKLIVDIAVAYLPKTNKGID